MFCYVHFIAAGALLAASGDLDTVHLCREQFVIFLHRLCQIRTLGKPDCSRLSVNPAHDASEEWRLPLGVRGKKDNLPCSLGNGDAGTSLGNPDIRVPDRTKREDGLRLEVVEDAENAEKTERKENEENTEEGNEDDDGRRNGNSVVPSETTDQRVKERNSDTRAYRHAPGGTWLTKNIFAGQEGAWEKREKRHSMGRSTTPLHY
ncbi:hypothetical protein NDU88_004934 [Pleurodeles waltl]|uniref:Uncharacterized protein n=1 Tax=Pleurodeles waltl TaxID=8319 RepID=A0AAV7PH37_PLEWA|nr:hypothetical protein NDU88_004934 [Pleurodeles waltl]